MKFFNFHLMPYAHVDLDAIAKNGSAWVTFSNSHYDPEKGAELYHDYLDQMEFADQLGFDGVCLNEHHQTAYGMMPIPGVLAGALARSVKHAKIAWQPRGHDPNLPKWLHRIDVPTLLIWGDHDRMFPKEHALAYQKAIPGAKVVIVPECGHVPQVEKPDAFVAALETFLGARKKAA